MNGHCKVYAQIFDNYSFKDRKVLIFEGNMRDGLPYGQGKHTEYVSEAVYEGNFKHGRYDGLGVFKCRKWL